MGKVWTIRELTASDGFLNVLPADPGKPWAVQGTTHPHSVFIDNPWMQALLISARFAPGSTLTYAFGTTAPESKWAESSAPNGGWEPGWKLAVAAAFGRFQDVTTLTIREQTAEEAAAGKSPNFLEWWWEGWWHGMPGRWAIPTGGTAADISTVGGLGIGKGLYAGTTAESFQNKFLDGHFGFVMLHELGHGFGLLHPFDIKRFPGHDSAEWEYRSHMRGDWYLSSNISTMMSYHANAGPEPFRNWVTGPDGIYESMGFVIPITLGALDIAALQLLYGANRATRTGNDVYRPVNGPESGALTCIWDAGGTDTISWDGESADATIDLRAATLSGPNASGYFSWGTAVGSGAFSIAYGVVIENAIGGSGNDRLIGNSANNWLEGGDGNDRLDGLAGHDTLLGGNGNDQLSGHQGDDLMTGGAGNDELHGGEGNDTAIFSGTRADYVIASSPDGGFTLRDLRDTGDGTDKLWNVEQLRFADGTITAPATRTGPGGSHDVISGNNRANVIEGGDGNDELSGLGGNDQIFGGNGIDRLFGGRDRDTLYGGNGSDFLDGGAGLDTLYGGEGNDAAIFAGTANDYVFAKNTDGSWLVKDRNGNTTDILHGIEFASFSNDMIRMDDLLGRTITVQDPADAPMYGFFGDDIIQGNDQANQQMGWDGNDQLFGQGGDDILSGCAGHDKLYGGTGNDRMSGDGGDDYLDGGTGTDTVCLDVNIADVSIRFSSNRLILSSAKTGTDTCINVEEVRFAEGTFTLAQLRPMTLNGTHGSDELTGGIGADIFNGGNGDDLMIDLHGADRFNGGNGIDTVSYTNCDRGIEASLVRGGLMGAARGDRYSGVENLVGTNSDDMLEGDSKANRLEAMDGDDILFGGAGDDRLLGGGGFNRFTGGAGADIFEIGGTDTITDFTKGSDRLIFSGSLNEVSFEQTANGLMIRYDKVSALLSGFTGTLTLADYSIMA
jgi:Ca2+-binding RTX toxin-like protein